MAPDPWFPAHEDSAALRGWEILRRRRGLAALVFAAVVASAVSFALYLPDLYQSSAVVLIERQALETPGSPVAGSELESRLHVIKEETLSRARLTDLINRFNLYSERRKRESLESILDQTRRDIRLDLNGPEQVSGRTKTVAFTLTYTGENRETVADVTNAIAAFYVDQNARIRSEQAIRTTEFLKAQLLEARKQLDRHEQNVRAFTTRHSGQLPEQVGVNLATLNRLNEQIRVNGEQQLNILEQRERLLEDAVLEPRSIAATQTLMSPELADSLRRLDQKRQELARAEIQFTPKHPDVIRLKDEIVGLEREVAERQDQEAQRNTAAEGAPAASATPQTGSSPTGSAGRTPRVPRARMVELLNEELERLKQTEADLRRGIATSEGRLESAPQLQQEFQLLSRDYQASKELYDSLLRRYDEAQIAESMETDRQGERFRVLEPAVAPEGPTAPNRLRLLVLGILLAAAAAAGAIALAEQVDTSFHNVDEIRAFTKVPVLASIPHIGPPSGTRVRMVLTTASALAAIALVAALSAALAHGNEQLVRMLVRAS
jgi:polysaccharide chain length determinant protein (PEP-CTERM system associated)